MTGASGATMQSIDVSLAGLDDDDQSASMALAETARGIAAEHTAIPWTIIAAGIAAFGGAEVRDGIKMNVSALEAALDAEDPDALYRSLTRAAVLDPDSDVQHQAIVAPDDGGDPERFEHFTRTEEVYQAALVASGLSEQDAGKVFALALEWELGVLNHCSVSATGSSQDSGAGSEAPPGLTMDTFNAARVCKR